jgi:hypothetical protein
VCDTKAPSPNKLPICFPLTLPSPLLFSLREAGERLLEPVTYLGTGPKHQGACKASLAQPSSIQLNEALEFRAES